MECLKLLHYDKEKVLQLIGILKITTTILDTFAIDDALDLIQENIFTLIPSQEFDLFIVELFHQDDKYIPYRFKLQVTEYEFSKGKWDSELNKWMNAHGRSQNISDLQYILNFYKDFDIFNKLKEDYCNEITYGNLVIRDGVNHKGDVVKKKTLGSIYKIDHRIFFIGASVNI
jgi:hypothetical protein